MAAATVEGRGRSPFLLGCVALMTLAAGAAHFHTRSVRSTYAPADSASLRIDLNTCTLPELGMLPGVGPVLAKKIFNERELHGRFEDGADLIARVDGVGEQRLEQIADLITFAASGEHE